MSYDLHFYKKPDNRVANRDIEKYLSAVCSASEAEIGTQFFYQNEYTGVYFIIDKIGKADALDGFDGYETLGLVFHLNYLRPDFFGIESFMILDEFIQKFDLYVYNPQDKFNYPTKPLKDDLYMHWTGMNSNSSRAAIASLNYLHSPEYPLDRSNRIWHHNYHVPALKEELGSDYFVPRVFFIQEKTTGQMATFAVCPMCAAVVPPADFYEITKKNGSSGLVPGERFVQALLPYITSSEDPACELVLFSTLEDSFDELEAAYENLSFEKTMADYQTIKYDDFINVDDD